jgi:hypothetical protein
MPDREQFAAAATERALQLVYPANALGARAGCNCIGCQSMRQIERNRAVVEVLTGPMGRPLGEMR